MSLGFFPIPPTVRKLFSSLTLASVPTSGLWGVGPEGLGAGLRRRGGAADLRTSRIALGGGLSGGSGVGRSLSARRRCWGGGVRLRLRVGRAGVVADMEQVGPQEVTGTRWWYEGYVLPADPVSLAGVRSWFRPTLPTPPAPHVPPPSSAPPRARFRGLRR